jgi:methionyl-tRNA synthetase
MPVIALSPEGFRSEYGIQCHRFFPVPGMPTPFGATYCRVGPSESTLPHQHHDGETFYLVSGHGRITIAGEADQDVRSGDVVFIPPHAEHQLTNLSGHDELTFYSVWWEDSSMAPADRPRQTIVYAAPPTPNGDLHLGHLSGPYLAVDVLPRYLRMRGVQVMAHTGTDDFQTYVATKGLATDRSPQAVTAHFGDRIVGTLDRFGIRPDHFLRPSQTPAYTTFVQAFFTRLRDQGALVLRDAPSLHCPTCDHYVHEARVGGLCPHCQTPTSGNGCERCYRPNDCADLIEPSCNHCGTPVQVVSTRRYYFDLESQRQALTGFQAAVSANPHVKALLQSLLDGELPTISVSHIADWGIPVPDRPGQVLYEWFEMAAGFLYSATQLSPDGCWESLWKDAETAVVQCFGFDNAFFFAAFLPAVLSAYDPAIRLPQALVSNEFYRLDGHKFSTSRNHAVWGDEALAHLPTDVVRFVLSHDRPQSEQTSFSLARLRHVALDRLIGPVQSWLYALQTDLQQECQSQSPVPLAPEAYTEAQRHFVTRLGDLAAAVGQAYEMAGFDLQRAARLLLELVSTATDFHHGQRYLQEVPSLAPTWATSIALELAAVKVFALLAAPVMPGVAHDLLLALGDDATSLIWPTTAMPLPAGRPITALTVPAFEGVEAGIAALTTAVAGRSA